MNLKLISFCAGDGVTVFVPEGFDPVNHLPFPAFVKDLCPVFDGDQSMGEPATECGSKPADESAAGQMYAVERKVA